MLHYEYSQFPIRTPIGFSVTWLQLYCVGCSIWSSLAALYIVRNAHRCYTSVPNDLLNTIAVLIMYWNAVQCNVFCCLNIRSYCNGMPVYSSVWNVYQFMAVPCVGWLSTTLVLCQWVRMRFMMSAMWVNHIIIIIMHCVYATMCWYDTPLHT